MERGTTINIFENGYIKLIRVDGTDQEIIEAARMSTDKGFLGWNLPCDKCNGTGANLAIHRVDGSSPCQKCQGSGVYGDERLLARLYRDKHMSPFEMVGLVLEVQAPIFVFREWHRHRTQSYNELSARYTKLPDLFYTPSFERMLQSAQDNINKQGSTDGYPPEAAISWIREIQDHYETARELYTQMLDNGVAREVARVVIPVGQISRMRASANLRNWLQFLTLRMDPAAQWEIRQYANALGDIIADVFPQVWKLFSADIKR